MTLDQLNQLEGKELEDELRKCCGSSNWISAVAAAKPFQSKEKLLKISDDAWESCDEQDYREAFSHHPRIGDAEAIRKKFASTAGWAEAEQAGVENAHEEVIKALAECNKLYEEKFGYIFIINATGKSAEGMLGSLRWRLLNTPEDEIKIAAEEQNQITKLRLEKLLA